MTIFDIYDFQKNLYLYTTVTNTESVIKVVYGSLFSVVSIILFIDEEGWISISWYALNTSHDTLGKISPMKDQSEGSTRDKEGWGGDGERGRYVVLLLYWKVFLFIFYTV